MLQQWYGVMLASQKSSLYNKSSLPAQQWTYMNCYPGAIARIVPFVPQNGHLLCCDDCMKELCCISHLWTPSSRLCSDVYIRTLPCRTYTSMDILYILCVHWTLWILQTLTYTTGYSLHLKSTQVIWGCHHHCPGRCCFIDSLDARHHLFICNLYDTDLCQVSQ